MKGIGGDSTKITALLAVVLSVMIAVIPPIGYFVISYQNQAAILETKAEALAYFTTKIINENPEFWQYQHHRLDEVLSSRLLPGREASHKIISPDENVIASNLIEVEPPVITRSHDLYDAGTIAARIDVSTSMRPMLIMSLLLCILGLIAGSAAFVILRIFPLRALAQAVKSLSESEERFRAITETAVDGIIVMDNQGRITYWNSAAEKMFGYTQQEAVGRELHFFLAPQEYHEEFKKGFEHFRTTGAGLIIGKTIEFSAVRKNGEVFKIELSTSAIKSRGEWHAVGLVHDITKRKSIETELYKSQQMLHLVLDNIPQKVFWKDRRFSYLGCNKSCALEAGLNDPSGIIGKNDIDLAWKENAEIYRADDKNVMETNTAKINYEEPLKLADGAMMWVRTSKVPLHDKDGNVIGVLGTFEDITAEKTSERRLADLYDEIKNEAEISRSLFHLVETLNTSLDEKELVKNVLNLAPQYLGFDRLGILVYDEELRGFTFVGGYGFSPFEENMLMAKTFKEDNIPAINKFVRGEPIIIDDAKEGGFISKEIAHALNLGSVVLSPISFRGKIGGIIGGAYSELRIYAKDVALLKGLADGMGVALQNSKLYKESNERLMELSNKIETIKTMAQLDREILSNIDKAGILRAATALTSRVIPCERAAVLFKEGDIFRIISEWGMGEFQDKTYDIKRSHFGIINQRRSSLFIPNLSEDKIDCAYHKELGAIGIKSSLIIPLISKGDVIGILDIGSTYYGRLTPAHLTTAEQIASQITVALENARLYDDVQQLLINTITTLASAIDAKSPWTKGHSERVTKYAIEIAKEMGLKDKEINHIKLCGLLHDIGKIGTYDMLLDKEDKLTDAERELVQKHTEKGAEILKPIKQLQEVILGVLYHHERYDGNGYPEGLRGEDIPLCARILSVADTFDSITADRPYRPSPGKKFAIEELKRCSGTQFDPKIVDIFMKILSKE
ncbi:MAG: PAS domain S-box protein [Nitrospirae bacterium]|nr:PAS domain S-box protein [Nitrospirota bacterium]